MKALLSIDHFSRNAITTLFTQAQQIEQGNFDRDIAKEKILIPLFFEPSTRTRLSFETAMLRLGGQVLAVPNTTELAIAKGESLEDTIRVVSEFGDILVMRHPSESAVYTAAQYSSIPLINGGNGCDEHPTQTLMDLYTIQKEKQTIDGLNIALIGDLKHARTMHSLLKGLSLYSVKLFLISPDELRTPPDLIDRLWQRQIAFVETPHLEEALPELDVMYIVMLQHHRIPDHQVVERLTQQYYRLTPDFLRSAKPEMIILHPLVRSTELSPEVDALPHAAYFRQIRNGVTVRMALLSHILSNRMF